MYLYNYSNIKKVIQQEYYKYLKYDSYYFGL